MNTALATLVSLMVLAVAPAVARAEDAQSTSYNIGGVSDYRYRGISQSRLQPALQGGVDYTNPNGVYLGSWASTIQWVKDSGGKADIEWDLYGGYKGEIAKDIGYDIGGLYYAYPGNKLGSVAGLAKADTFEIYAAVSYRAFTLKYSHSLSNLFGFVDSKGSGYLDLSASFDLGNGFSLAPHIGRQEVRHSSAYSYTDYSLTLGKDLGGGLSVSAALTGTDAGKNLYLTPAGKFTGRNAVVLGAKYGF